MYSAKLAGEILLDSRQPILGFRLEPLPVEDMKKLRSIPFHAQATEFISSVRPPTYL